MCVRVCVFVCVCVNANCQSRLGLELDDLAQLLKRECFASLPHYLIPTVGDDLCLNWQLKPLAELACN